MAPILDTSKAEPKDTVPIAGSKLAVTSDGIYNAISEKQAVNLKFTSVSTSSWASDNTYSDYPYKGTIALTGVTSSDIAEVVFSLADATSGDYAPICETYEGGVYIWSAKNTSITIPTILVHKG